MVNNLIFLSAGPAWECSYNVVLNVNWNSTELQRDLEIHVVASLTSWLFFFSLEKKKQRIHFFPVPVNLHKEQASFLWHNREDGSSVLSSFSVKMGLL